VEDALTELRKFEAELKVKSAHLKNLRVDISNPTASLSQLKGTYDWLTNTSDLVYLLLHTSFILSLSLFLQISLREVVYLRNSTRRHRSCRTTASASVSK
jgi:hypothetical protein